MDWGIAKLHPVALLCVLSAWLFGMFFYAQSLYGLLFLAANLLWYVWRLGRQGIAPLRWYMLLAAVTVLFHLFFYHHGRQILFYFWGRPILAEGLIYGLYMGALLLSLLLFWQVGIRVFLGEKWLWLWRRLLPQTAMVFLFSGGLFARCKRNMEEKWQILSCQQRGKQSLAARCKLVGDSLYSFAGWSIQWGMETVDSVNSRGYGLREIGKGTSYSWRSRDWAALGFFLLVVIMAVVGHGAFLVDGNLFFIGGLVGFFGYWEGKEGRIWRRYTE